jgi:methylglutaconyl-CoA hydratase
MENGYVNLTSENGISTVTFFHPKSNSLPGTILRELAEAVTKAGEDPGTRVIVLKSDGDRAFCAGASFDELLSIQDFPTGKEFFMGFARVINAMRKAPKFVITRVHGKAVGGGVGLVSASDYVFAVKSAAAKLSELALGIGPFVVGPAVERKTGKAKFSQMATDFEWYSADWCFDSGLYAHLFENAGEMDEALNDFLEKTSKLSPEAMKELKNVYWQGTENWDELLEQRAEISGRLVTSDFTRDYIKQFKNR